MKHIIRNYDGSIIEEEFKIADSGRKCHYYIDGKPECTVEQLETNGVLDVPSVSWSTQMTTDCRFMGLFVVTLEFAAIMAKSWNRQTGKAVADIPYWY
jgi:hypothetical protein